MPASVKIVGDDETKVKVTARANTRFASTALNGCTFVLKFDPFTVVTMAGDTYIIDNCKRRKNLKNLKNDIARQYPEVGGPQTFDLFTEGDRKIDQKNSVTRLAMACGDTITLVFKSNEDIVKDRDNCNCHVM
eukprot:m.213306 g.213306  ORF g.213306 m.213306 type:complete len:133 (+) comp33147_c1_seq3:265-663(+)